MKVFIKLILLLLLINCTTTSDFNKRKYTKVKMGSMATTGKQTPEPIRVKELETSSFIKNTTEDKENLIVKKQINEIANQLIKVIINKPVLSYLEPVIDSPDIKKQEPKQVTDLKKEKVEGKQDGLSLGKKILGGISLGIGLFFFISGIVLIASTEAMVVVALLNLFFGFICLGIGVVFLVLACIIFVG